MSGRVASTLEFLHVDNVRYVRPGGFVLKALQTIAKGSPGLDTLTLKLCNRMDGAAMVLNQIGAFSQIRKLTCEGLDFELKSRKVNFGVLANLGSLQVSFFFFFFSLSISSTCSNIYTLC